MTAQQSLIAPTLPRIDEWRALSLLQPWLYAILDDGPLPKRLENRDWKHGSDFRGPVMLHASAGMTKGYYADVVRFAETARLAWRPPPFADVQRGGILGICEVYGVVRTSDNIDHPDFGIAYGQHPWWMGGFALALRNVRRTPFVPCKGSLGFWRVPVGVAMRALGEA